ncbi:hypothetical protein [Aurantimonas sp. C2-4-R8]|uniref:hypothetical protein n=1 Tax=Aurantimonas sp. C2-4-R8 TaxID=3114364 RepID=UPI002E19AB59|nr:hypothetical protein [Aurantimonas sp. C2-4-R8]
MEAGLGRVSKRPLNAERIAEAAPSPIPDRPTSALRPDMHVASGGISSKTASDFATRQRFALTPANPDRPFTSRTCVEALTRLREVAKGSPLIDPQENQAVPMKAIDQAIAVCSKEVRRKRS